MTVSTIPPVTPLLKFFDSNGAPLAYGQLFTYQTATSTKQATYTDSTGNTPNTNPIILNARGEATVWLDSSLVYKFVLAPSTDTDPPANPISTQDPIGSFNISQTTGNFTSITVSAQGQIAYLNLTGSTLPANGLYLPAVNRLGFATNTKARGYIDSGGIWTLLAPDSSGPALIVPALGVNNVNTIQLPTAGSLINMARSADGALTGFYGSRASTTSFSVYNSGGSTAEVGVGPGTIGLATNTIQRIGISGGGIVTVQAPDAAGKTLSVVGQAANTTNVIELPTAGSMINFARSSDASLAGFVGSRSGTTSTSIYQTGGSTAEVEVDGGTINLKSNALTRTSINANGTTVMNGTATAATATLTVGADTAITAGGAQKTGVAFTSTANFGVFAGSGVPTITAAKGSLYLRSDGSSSSTRMYVASDSAGTWVAVTTAS